MDGGVDFSHPVRNRKAPSREARFAHWLRNKFVIPSGPSAGKPFTLEPFQLEFVRAFLERDTDGPRWRNLVFSISRKQGKTALMAALLLGLMCPDSPIHKPGFAGAVAAPSEKHATYIAASMVEIMKAAGRDKEIARRVDPKPGRVEIGDTVLWLSSGTRAQGHGLSLDCAIIDEMGLITQNQSELVTAFHDSLAIKNGQLILVGTRGDSPIFNEMIDRPDKTTHVTLYAADKDDDPGDPAVWRKANPGLGSIKPIRFMRDAFERAQASGSMTEFCAWNLNMPLTPGRELLLEYDVLRKSYRDEVATIPGENCFVGIDLGGSASMTAATVTYEQSGVVKVLGAFPGADLDLRERGKRDLVGDLWERCALAGELIETSGSVSDLQEFLPALVALIGPHPVRSVSCDRYRDAEMRTAMAKARLDWPVIYRGTGPKDGDADIRATRRLFLAGAVQMKRSLLLEGSMAEADIRVSATGACVLSKSHPHARVDVCSSLVLACSALLRARDEVKPEYIVEVL